MHACVTGGFRGFWNLTLLELPAQRSRNHKIQVFRLKQAFPSGVIDDYALQKTTGLFFHFHQSGELGMFSFF